MSAQGNYEKILKDIHLKVAECPKIKGEPDKIVIDKRVLFQDIDRISQCFYDLMDEFELTKSHKEEAKYQIHKQYNETVEQAEKTAEDVYSASMLYTDEAITRITRIIENSEKELELMYVGLERELQREVDRLRNNQKELQDQLFDMKDSNLYLDIITNRKKQIRKDMEEAEAARRNAMAKSPVVKNTPEIRINKAYFELMGLNEDGTPKAKEVKAIEAPEIKVDVNSNYFKWKKKQEEEKNGATEEKKEV